MNKSSRSAAFFLALCSLGGLQVHAQELRVSATLVPSKEGVQVPKVQVASEDSKLEAKGASVWAYAPKTSGKLIGTSSVAFEQPPPDYSSERLRIRLPWGRTQPIQVALFGLQIQDTNQRVREIFGINVASDQMRSEELFRLYQETSVLSLRRLNTIRQEKRPLYVFDVQIFFKYLEIARELGRNKFLAVSDNVLQVQTYLREQIGIEAGRSAMVKALGPKGPKMVETLLKEIDFVDAEQLRQIWQTLATAPPSFTLEACGRYREFVKTLEDFDELLVKRWNATDDYRMATLALEALHTCASRAEAAASADPKAAAAEVGEISKVANEVSIKAFSNVRIQSSTAGIDVVGRRLSRLAN
ncbi:hypothetical protein [Rhizobacter fulvus]